MLEVIQRDGLLIQGLDYDRPRFGRCEGFRCKRRPRHTVFYEPVGLALDLGLDPPLNRHAGRWSGGIIGGFADGYYYVCDYHLWLWKLQEDFIIGSITDAERYDEIIHGGYI